jgi:hypothetical protein
MKFCKNLQRVADLSNPEWVPFFTDYKKLKVSENFTRSRVRLVPPKHCAYIARNVTLTVVDFLQKIIKGLSDLELDRTHKQGDGPASPSTRSDTTGSSLRSPHSTPGSEQSGSHKTTQQQSQVDSIAESSSPSDLEAASATNQPHSASSPQDGCQSREIDTIRRKPGEILFFKLLHAEFQKAVHFFDRMIDELTIREERVVEGCEIVRRENRFQLWSMLAKSVYRLHTDLLLLENFCIMTYCSFSKILKKHDKVTRFDTRNAFMSNVVNKANFTNYTNLQAMIARCEQLYSEVSDRMVEEGQENLYEDERLFIEMVHQLNQQA